MRRSELFKLQWQHIDFDKGFIHIIGPKGGKDQTIPLNQAARDILENHPRDAASSYVFPGRGGGQRVEIRRSIDRIRKAAELPKDFRPLHGLRHTFASMLASSGEVDLYTLQKLLTHKTSAMTQRYAHLRDDALRRASNLAGDLIGQVVNGNRAKTVNLAGDGYSTPELGLHIVSLRTPFTLYMKLNYNNKICKLFRDSMVSLG